MHSSAARALVLLFAFGCAGTSPERVVRSLRPALDVQGRPAVRWSVAERLAHHDIPGVSIAVADRGRIVWARGFGVLEAGRDERVSASALFQAASISKVIAATATLRLADRGTLDLDADVNRYLRSWQVPENELTARKQVTLRRILSHQAGLSVHGFTGYPHDRALPTILQVLDGKAPAATKPVRVVSIPGTTTSYSGGGTTVQQLLLTDVTQRPFPLLMKELVLSPLGMNDSTFEQPLPEALRARVARGHADGRAIEGGWRIGPEMAAGWLWTTPADLLRWAIAIDEARDGKAGAILSRRTATEMLTLQQEPYGLGPVLEGSGRAFRFSHGGNNPGYTTQLTYFPETGQGAAIMVNSVGADMLIDELTRAIAAEYGWPALAPLQVTPAILDETALARIAGNYEIRFPGAKEPSPAQLWHENGRLAFHAPPIVTDDEVIPLSSTELVSPAWGYTIRFDAPGGFTVTYGQNVMTGTRVP